MIIYTIRLRIFFFINFIIRRKFYQRHKNSSRGDASFSQFDLYIGNAFDVVGKKKRMKFRSLGREGEESSFEVSIANRKLRDVEVVVSERIPGDWEMLESTVDYEWITANRVEFKFTVAANEEKTIEYSIRINRRY